MENTQIPYQQEQKPVEYAGFWWRFLASVIDSLIISFAGWIIILPIMAMFGLSLYSLQQAGYNTDDSTFLFGPFLGFIIMAGIVSTLAQWLYFALMESSRTKGTLGKMALKIKVTNYDGQRISFGQATGRYFAKIISSLILLIGYIMAGFTLKKQALHDIMANCYVIKEPF
jgi:uncharacterized RDD family membrane protein YckC